MRKSFISFFNTIEVKDKLSPQGKLGVPQSKGAA